MPRKCTTAICSIGTCSRHVKSRGYCRGHYIRLWRNSTFPKLVIRTEQERFWIKVDRSGGPDACWLWMAFKLATGYGRFAPTGQRVMVFAHRYAYKLLVGQIPDGLELDHRCRNPSCVNVTHLEPVTHAINMARANVARTHCKRGHPIDTTRSNRQCIICSRATKARYRVSHYRDNSPKTRKTHCPQGHPYDEWNTTHSTDGYRLCRTCRNAVVRARMAKKRQTKHLA